MIFRANDAFGTTVLWSTVSVEEGTGGGVIKLTAIIALDGLDRGAKLSGNIRKKLERVENVSDLRRTGKVHE